MTLYLKIIKRIISMSWQVTMVYPMAATILFFSNAIYFVGTLILIWFLFKLTGDQGISGYNVGQFFLVFGVSEFIFFYLFGLIVDSAYMFQNDLHLGKLDYSLIKPISPIFLNSFRWINIDEFVKGAMALSTCIILAGWTGLVVTIGEVWLVLIILLASLVILYFCFWTTFLLCFFQDRFYALNSLYFQLAEVTRLPKKMYPVLMQQLLTYVVPVFLIANPVFNVLDRTYNWQLGLQLILVVVMFGLIYFNIWLIGLKNYNSAN